MKRIVTVVLLVVLALSVATGIYIWRNSLPEKLAITPASGGYTLIN